MSWLGFPGQDGKDEMAYVTMDDFKYAIETMRPKREDWDNTQVSQGTPEDLAVFRKSRCLAVGDRIRRAMRCEHKYRSAFNHELCMTCGCLIAGGLSKPNDKHESSAV